jgi:hypothetical protein
MYSAEFFRRAGYVMSNRITILVRLEAADENYENLTASCRKTKDAVPSRSNFALGYAVTKVLR